MENLNNIPKCPEGARLIPLGKDKYAIVDTEDYEQLNQHSWSVSKGGKTWYAHRGLGMHREVMNAPANLVVHHKNHNGLDNRKQNLQICTHQENQQDCEGGLQEIKRKIQMGQRV